MIDRKDNPSNLHEDMSVALLIEESDLTDGAKIALVQFLDSTNAKLEEAESVDILPELRGLSENESLPASKGFISALAKTAEKVGVFPAERYFVNGLARTFLIEELVGGGLMEWKDLQPSLRGKG